LPVGTKLYAFPPDAAGEIERLTEVLRELGKPTYGTEWTQTGEERAEILGRHLFSIQDKARAALAGKEPKP
jgi:hypothetical protein